MKKQIWYCKKCGSTNVEIKVWQHANNGNISGDIGDDEDTWCNNCESHAGIILKEIEIPKPQNKNQKLYDHINHLTLRSDFENDGLLDETLFLIEGKISNSPETWAIDAENYEESYLYESKHEYEQDVEILKKLNKIKTS